MLAAACVPNGTGGVSFHSSSQHTHSSIGAEDIDTVPVNTQMNSKWIQG